MNQIDDMINEIISHQPVGETRIHAKRMIKEDIKRIQEKFISPITQAYLINKHWGLDLDCDRSDKDYGDPTGL